MKYYLDTEFIEGFHKPLFGKKHHFIDLISIGIVCDDGREYYAISKEFDYRDADNWVKENVVVPIHNEIENSRWEKYKYMPGYFDTPQKFSHGRFKRNLKYTGKSLLQIRREIVDFMGGGIDDMASCFYVPEGTEVYAYYADYDWVVFCSIFGRMIDLPSGMPMYCRDLKQTYDEKNLWWTTEVNRSKNVPNLKDASDYPKQDKEHNALDDAKWNKKLHDFIKSV